MSTPPTSAQLYHDVNEIIQRLSESLADMIWDRIVTDVHLEGSIPLASFHHDASIRTGSQEYYVFQSEHYRNLILRKAEKFLSKAGYDCCIQYDTTGRLRVIRYSAQIVPPLQTMMKMMFTFLSILIGIASIQLYNYYMYSVRIE
jgi:hypothetical protein